MRIRGFIAVTIAALLSVGRAPAEELKGAQEREYAVSLPSAKAALQNLGAFTGARLPSVEGFTTEQVEVQKYQRPYYEYKIELVPVTPSKTRVQVKASVSVWYEGSDGPSGYRTLTSNGRLETDLLDRLGEYLKDKSDDPKVLAQTIAELSAQREQAEAQVSRLEEQLKALQKGTDTTLGSEFVSVKRRAMVLSVPAQNARVLLRAQPEDEFQVRGHRGEWLEVGLAGEQTGWVKRSEVSADAPMAATIQPAAPSVPGFTVIRESASDFSGDWARLRAKKALYVWARPDGSALNVGTGDRLAFVERIFTERYREIVHGAGDPVDGVVIIFLDQRGGVAAATLDDIRLLVEGSISASSFLKKCSLDPPSAFQEATSTPAANSKRRVSYRSTRISSHGS